MTYYVKVRVYETYVIREYKDQDELRKIDDQVIVRITSFQITRQKRLTPLSSAGRDDST